MSRKIRVGVLGLDHWYWATSLIPEILKHPRLSLAAIYEPAAWRMKMAKYSPERVAETPAQVTDAEDIDLVISLMPCPAGARWMARAAGNGKALICNKPLAMTLSAGRRIVHGLAARKRPSFSLEGTSLLSGLTRLIRGVIRGGEIGRPLTVFSCMRGGMPMAWWDRGGKTGRRNWGWWTDPKLVPGGAWIDHSIYAISQFRSILGDEPSKVNATFANIRHSRAMPGMEDYGIATYTYRKGARVTMEYDWIGKMGSFNSIVGEKGWMRWGYGVKHGCVELSTAGKTRQVGIPGKRDADASVLDHMVRCLDERRETAHPASLGLDNLRIALAAYQASRAGRTVSIPRR